MMTSSLNRGLSYRREARARITCTQSRPRPVSHFPPYNLAPAPFCPCHKHLSVMGEALKRKSMSWARRVAVENLPLPFPPPSLPLLPPPTPQHGDRGDEAGGGLVSKHGAKRPQKPYGLLGTGRRRGGRGMEVGGEGDYIPIATLSPLE